MRCSQLLMYAFVLLGCQAVVTPALYAQGQGRIFGSVLDEDGDTPIVGALVRVDNPEAARVFEATSGADGRFTLFGLTSGNWNVSVSAEGYAPTSASAPVMQSVGQPVSIWLQRIRSPLELALGAEALAGKDPAAVARDLGAADAAFNEQRWNDALAGYRAILAEVPGFTSLHAQIGNTHRAKGDYEEALAAYERLRAVEPENEDVPVEIARTRLAMGDPDAARDLETAMSGANASREDLFNLGEVAFAAGDLARGAALYQQSSDIDPNWGKPLFKLALVALNQGDTDRAKQFLQRVVDVDPDSPEAREATATLAALP